MAKTSLVIDNRESKIKEVLNTYTYENLELGDFIIRLDDIDFLVFERKTIADLAASIKDGRYADQKLRLLSHYDSSKVHYIIEGSFDFSTQTIHDSIPKSTLISCVINTMIRDNIKCFFTKSPAETCSLIEAIFSRIEKDPGKYTHGGTPSTMQKPTRKITSRDECYISQLCQVPDISTKTAMAIAKKYPSFQDLFAAFIDIDEPQKLKRLKEITTTDSQGKDRRISEKVAKNIIQYML